jgi:hypothetical protein
MSAMCSLTMSMYPNPTHSSRSIPRYENLRNALFLLSSVEQQCVSRYPIFLRPFVACPQGFIQLRRRRRSARLWVVVCAYRRPPQRSEMKCQYVLVMCPGRNDLTYSSSAIFAMCELRSLNDLSLTSRKAKLERFEVVGSKCQVRASGSARCGGVLP